MGNAFSAMKFKQWRPSITFWNRLEGRARAEDFDRAMKAEVRDALWMLSRQWQMGEFIGDDAGSPVLAKAHIATALINKYQSVDGPVQPFEQDIPLEVKVEHQSIAFNQGELLIALDVRLLMGRQWLKWVAKIDYDLRSEYIDQYGISRPDASVEADAAICAHVTAWQQFAAVAGRSMDGYRLYAYLKKDPAHHAYDAIAGVDSELVRDALDKTAVKFVQWFEKLYYQPDYQAAQSANTSWRPEYLEHQFSCSAAQQGTEKTLIADAYYHGHLDWYNLDISPDQSGLGAGEMDPESGDAPVQPVNAESTVTRSFIPASVTFGGMPHSRWWKFENWKTDPGFVKPDTTDINKLLLLDFMLVYSNDWFIVPVTLAVGSIAKVKGLSVKNVFGEHTWIEAAGSGSDQDWQRWNMYSASIKGNHNVPSDSSLITLPVAQKTLVGKALEEVFLLRDEVANRVWGVEARIALASGKSVTGKEAAYELKNKLQQLANEQPDSPVTGAAQTGNEAKIRYQLVNSVPEQWIPFIPVHIENTNREIQLQRAAMPRILNNTVGAPKKIEPRTSLLRSGLDQKNKQPYFIHEEEIPRAGIKIHKSFQRTRWYNGRVYNWLGIRKQIGRGQGSSGLVFDQIIPLKNR